MSPPSSSVAPAAPVAARGRSLSREGVVAFALLAALAAVMFATLGDYGMTGDEGVQHRYARRVLRWYATLGADGAAAADEDVSMYGAFFEILAEGAAFLTPGDPYRGRHAVNVLFALAAFAAVMRMGWQLAGPAGGLASFAVLVLTPPFYGHAFNNPKDIPFAGSFAAAACVILAVSERSPRLRTRDVLAAGSAIGLTAGVRVAGIALFGFALVLWLALACLAPRPAATGARRREITRLLLAWAGAVVVGWAVMVAVWPWAQKDPLRNPFRALRAFSRFWETMVVFHDGRYVPNGQVSRFYLPEWLALTLPEAYALAAVLGLVALGTAVRHADPVTRRRVLQASWLAAVAVLPVAWVVIRKTPLYDGQRHFLFVLPLLAVLAGVSIAVFVRQRWPRREAKGAVLAAAALGALTLADMVALHPYQAVYFNRLVAGGLAQAVERYDTDYWCLSYKEGAEWLRARYGGASCAEKVRVAGHSILLQTAYYFRQDGEDRRLFSPVSPDDRPHFIMATTRYGDHRRIPGRLVHTVERQGAALLYLFEVRPPPCTPAR